MDSKIRNNTLLWKNVSADNKENRVSRLIENFRNSIKYLLFMLFMSISNNAMTISHMLHYLLGIQK
jgi:hypothetical protein